MQFLLQALVMVFLLGQLWAAQSDLRRRTIANWLTVGLALLFFPAGVAAGLGLAAFGWHLLAGVIMLAGGTALFARGLLGGGDVKLLTATALWFGLWQLPWLLLATAVIGGLVALLFLFMKSPVGTMLLTWTPGLAPGRTEEGGVPYGLAIALGAIFALGRLPLLPAGWDIWWDIR